MASTTVLKFSLKIGAIGPNVFRVQDFTLSENMSESFSLNIAVSSEEGNHDYADMIGKDATLKVTGEDFTISHHGVVTQFMQHPDASSNFGHESYGYEILIEPHFKLLKYNTQNRIFHNLTVKEIVQEVLTGNGLSDSTHFKFRLQASYSNREYTVQYNETDFDFVSRLLEHEGIFYFFDHTGNTDVLVMADKIEAIKPIIQNPKVDLKMESGLSHGGADHILSFKRKYQMVTGKAKIKDYNDRTPSLNVIGTTIKPGQGEDYHFGLNVKTASEAEKIANLRSESNTCQKIVLTGTSLCRDFRAGMRFELVDPHDYSHFAGKYTILSVFHHGDQREGFEGSDAKMIYTNTFTCIPADTLFRPKLITNKPKISGVITAKVDGVAGKYAFIDEDGRYRAKLPFDLSDTKDGKGSLPIRLMQPYGGPNFGTHFPLHNGNDLVISFIDGDVDRPIALGISPNPSNQSPVTKNNNHESMIRTASGHQIRLDDKEDKTVIEITTKGKHTITFNDDEDHKEIHLKTTDGNEMIFDDKNKNIRIMTPDGAHLIKLDYDKKVLSAETKYGHKLTMDDEKKKIALQTKDGHILMLDDDKKLMALQDGKGKHSLQIDAGGGLVSITTDGDMEFTAKGSLNIAAKEINMQAKSGAINVKASAGDISVEGMNVNVKGKQKVAIEGTVEASLKGAQTKIEGSAKLDLKSSGPAKLTGLQVSVEGQAMAEVKGAVVLIN